MLIDLATGLAQPVVAQAPVASSSSSPWDGILVEEHGPVGPLELEDVAPPEAVVIIQLAPQKSCEWRDYQGGRELRFTQGQVHLIPAMYPFSMRARNAGNILSVSVATRFLRCAAHDYCREPKRMELSHQAPLEDPLLRELALSLKREIDGGYRGGKLYGESLAAALAVHLVRHYSNLDPSTQPSRADHGQIRSQIREAIHHIHDHFASDLSLATLSKLAELSPFHFARLFRESTGLAPHQYIVQRRVERARELLLSGNQTTAEIAVAVGFCDQSHLTTHFKRAFGLTPKKFRLQAKARRSP